MPGVRDIKRRIRSVKSIQQITKAMQMVAAAKLRRTQEAAIASRPYTHKLEEVLGRIVSKAGESEHPLLVTRQVKNIGFVVITADRGQAGGYNANLIRRAMLEAARRSEYQTGFIAVGRKIRDFLKRRNKPILAEFLGIKDIPTFLEAQRIAQTAVDAYAAGTYDEVHLIYQEFISPLHQRPVIKQLLPIPVEQGNGEEGGEYLYEPEPAQVLGLLLPKYVNNVIYHALMEAKAGEFGARMTAMSSATDNAGEMMDKLTLSFNRARQAAITREISEIVGGANALKG